MYVILNWLDTVEASDIGLVHDEDGSVMKFSTFTEAVMFAADELNGEARIINLQGD